MSSAFGRALSAVSVLVEAARANKIGAMHSPVSAREIVNAVRTQNLPEAFKEAERQVDEVVRVLAPGPLVTPLDETETRDAEEAVRQATRRWKEKQGSSRERRMTGLRVVITVSIQYLKV